MGLSRGIEMGSKLMHASIFITHAFLWFVVFSFLSYFPCSTSISFHDNDTSSSDDPLLFTTTALYTICHDGIYHFTPQPLLAPYGCHSKTAHWPTSHPASTIALNVLVAPLLISRQNSLSYFFTSLCFHYSHLDKD